jgi:hypothetical protein
MAEVPTRRDLAWVALADFLGGPVFAIFVKLMPGRGPARRLLVASPAPSGEDGARRLVLPLSGIGVRGRHCQNSQLSGTCRKGAWPLNSRTSDGNSPKPMVRRP